MENKMAKLLKLLSVLMLVLTAFKPCFSKNMDMPSVLSIRDQALTVNQITKLRLDRLLPKIMQETNFDMWVIICNEDNYDPVFKTMIPLTPGARLFKFWFSMTGDPVREWSD